ncbi:hypothetical protein BKA93DRAFT_179527 [Sparassis latifolia]
MAAVKSIRFLGTFFASAPRLGCIALLPFRPLLYLPFLSSPCGHKTHSDPRRKYSFFPDLLCTTHLFEFESEISLAVFRAVGIPSYCHISSGTRSRLPSTESAQQNLTVYTIFNTMYICRYSIYVSTPRASKAKQQTNGILQHNNILQEV